MEQEKRRALREALRENEIFPMSKSEAELWYQNAIQSVGLEIEPPIVLESRRGLGFRRVVEPRPWAKLHADAMIAEAEEQERVARERRLTSV